MQCLRVEIRPIRPYQGMHFGIEAYLLEEIQIAQWAIELAGQYWP